MAVLGPSGRGKTSLFAWRSDWMRRREGRPARRA
ncbi:hypothetical protein [Phenylobacterium sp. J367]